MPFGASPRSAPAPAPSLPSQPAPGYGGPAAPPPAHHAAPAAPPAAPVYGAPAAPAASAPAAAPFCFAYVNGEVKPVTEAQLREMDPNTQVMPLDQSRGWAPASSMLAAAPAVYGAPHQPQQAAPPAYGQRPAYGQQQPQQGYGQQPQQGAPRGVFAGVTNAEVYRRNDNVNPGDYVAKLLGVEFKHGRNGKNYLICELKVLVSSFDPNRPDSLGCNKEGTNISVFIQQNDSWGSNIKEIILALSGFDQNGNPRPDNDVVTEAEAESLLAPNMPFAGALVYLNAREITTKAGNPYTRVSWYPCPTLPDGSPDLQRLQR